MGAKFLQQRDLLVREWPYLVPINCDNAQAGIILPQTCCKKSASAPEVDHGETARVAVQVEILRHQVFDV